MIYYDATMPDGRTVRRAVTRANAALEADYGETAYLHVERFGSAGWTDTGDVIARLPTQGRMLGPGDKRGWIPARRVPDAQLGSQTARKAVSEKPPPQVPPGLARLRAAPGAEAVRAATAREQADALRAAAADREAAGPMNPQSTVYPEGPTRGMRKSRVLSRTRSRGK